MEKEKNSTDQFIFYRYQIGQIRNLFLNLEITSSFIKKEPKTAFNVTQTTVHQAHIILTIWQYNTLITKITIIMYLHTLAGAVCVCRYIRVISNVWSMCSKAGGQFHISKVPMSSCIFSTNSTHRVIYQHLLE